MLTILLLPFKASQDQWVQNRKSGILPQILYKGLIKYSRTPSGCPFQRQNTRFSSTSAFQSDRNGLDFYNKIYTNGFILFPGILLWKSELPFIGNIQPSFILSFKIQIQRPLHALKLVTANVTDQEMFDTLIISIQSLH